MIEINHHQNGGNMSTPTIRAALERLLNAVEIKPGAGMKASDVDSAIAFASVALAAGGGLSAKEVEAQHAFTQMRDEILNLSDGVEVNEVLGIIDNYTPEWV